MLNTSTITGLSKKATRQAIACGLLTPIFYLLLLAAVRANFGQGIRYDLAINGFLILIAIIAFIKNKKNRSASLTEVDKIASLNKLITLLVYLKYAMILSIGIFVLAVPLKSKQSMMNASGCQGSELKKKFEVRFPAQNLKSDHVNVLVEGKQMPFRNDIVIRNEDILKVEDSKGQFGESKLKVIYNLVGKEKLSRGTSESVGQIVVVLVDGALKSSPTITDRIEKGETDLSLDNGIDTNGAILPLTSKDICLP